MGKPNCDDRQFFERTSSPSSILQPPVEFDMNCHEALSQSDPSIQPRKNHLMNRLATSTCNSASYKVSIGHETVNITEITRHRDPSPVPTTTTTFLERRRFITAHKSANILSLCFMCFISTSLILIAISAMHLLLKTNYHNNNDMIPLFLQPVNITSGLLYMFATPITSTETIPDMVIPIYDRTIRDLATVVCLLIVVLNCFSLLIFSIEVYLGCNMMTTKQHSYRNINLLFSSSTARFIAICGFYTSIPALILVMCLFILLNMSLIPAIISLLILGFGLVFILITLLTYFSKMNGINTSVYHPDGTTHFSEDDIDLTKAEELSTLV